MDLTRPSLFFKVLSWLLKGLGLKWLWSTDISFVSQVLSATLWQEWIKLDTCLARSSTTTEAALPQREVSFLLFLALAF